MFLVHLHHKHSRGDELRVQRFLDSEDGILELQIIVTSTALDPLFNCFRKSFIGWKAQKKKKKSCERTHVDGNSGDEWIMTTVYKGLLEELLKPFQQLPFDDEADLLVWKPKRQLRFQEYDVDS
jgi:hypothetical protein